MGKNSRISWTDHTFSPWWGCTKHGPECLHCYAESTARRWGTAWGPRAHRTSFGNHHWKEPIRWNSAAEKSGIRARVFCASMADVCEDRSDLNQPRARLQQLVLDTPWLDWILLTKRPENYERFFSPDMLVLCRLGATAGTNASLERVIGPLMEAPSQFRWLSMEPLLERIEGIPAGLDGIVVGAESGPGARPCQMSWIHGVVQQCDLVNVPVHVKQIRRFGELVRDVNEFPENVRRRDW